MKEQLFSIIIALLFTMLGVAFSLQWPNEFRIIDSVFLGLFAYLITTSSIVLWSSNRLKGFSKLQSDVEFTANHLRVQEAVIKKGSRSFDLFWSLSLLRAKEGIYKLLHSGDFTVSREQTPSFWLQAIKNTDSSWLSTNIVHTKQDWRSGWEHKGVSYQKLGIELSNTTIKRIFIFESLSEICDDMISMMKMHQDNNIQVKWITKDSDNLHWSPFKLFENNIGTNDFAMIDNEYLLLFNLDEEKELIDTRCTRNENLLASISNLYTRLWEQSKSIDEIKNKA